MSRALVLVGTVLGGAAVGAGVADGVSHGLDTAPVVGALTPVLLAVCIAQLAALRQSVDDLRAAVVGRLVAPVVQVDPR